MKLLKTAYSLLFLLQAETSMRIVAGTRLTLPEEYQVPTQPMPLLVPSPNARFFTTPPFSAGSPAPDRRGCCPRLRGHLLDLGLGLRGKGHHLAQRPMTVRRPRTAPSPPPPPSRRRVYVTGFLVRWIGVVPPTLSSQFVCASARFFPLPPQRCAENETIVRRPVPDPLRPVPVSSDIARRWSSAPRRLPSPSPVRDAPAPRVPGFG